jgi:putative salt-induced outer membrane protein YdiY
MSCTPTAAIVGRIVMSRYMAAVLLLFGLLMSHIVWADQIRLKNGDILTGEVVKKESDKVVFRTDYAGELEISWSEVASLDSQEAVRIVLTDDRSMEGRLVPDGKGQAIVQTEGGKEMARIKLIDLLYINPSAEVSGVGITWTGNINLGGTFTQGNSDTSLLHFDAETVARRKRDRFTVGGIVNRGESEGFDTVYNSRVYGKYDYFLNRRWYAYVNAAGENDKFRDIRLRTSTGVGSGFQIFEQPGLNLSIEGGLNYITADYYVDEDESYPGGRWALKYDQKIFGGDTEIFHQHEFLFGFLNGKNTLLFSKTGLRVPIADRLKASTQLNIDWAKEPSPGRESTDLALIFSLGYDW